MRYRRVFTPGGTYFFTVNLANRSEPLLTNNIDGLRKAVRRVKAKHSFDIDAIVVLPDHIHAIWTLPNGDADYPMRWSLIKAGFSRTISKSERTCRSRLTRRERGIWQRRYWEHQIQDACDLERHVDYIHFNPVKHGHVEQATDWPYSSIHKYIRHGLVPADWSGVVDDDARSYGE